jgi:uncharacterized protein YndB with AHSA1/START domain
MTESSMTPDVRVTHHVSASAERVYDAFLDPEKASRFLFATGTGQIVRCEINARVGGTFTIVDRRHGENVAHTGTYLELARPSRIVFTLTVPKFSSESNTVTIEITPLARGCELTLTQTMAATAADDVRKRVEQGWRAIVEVAGTLLPDETPTCGAGLAEHAAVPAWIGRMCEALAETLASHRSMLVLDDANARKEDEVYRELAERWREIARLIRSAAAQMDAQRELPMGTHDETKWGRHHHRAFEEFVTSQSQLLTMLRVAADRDEKMLASMKQ